MMKVCNGCHKEFDLSDFYRKCDTYDGLTSRCKTCIRESKKRTYRKHKERILAKHAKWYQENKEELRKKAKEKYCPEKNREQCRAYYQANKTKVRQINDAWAEANPEKVKGFHRKYGKANQHIRNAWSSKRRAVQKRAYGWNKELTDLTEKEAQIIARARTRSTGISHQVDHIIPINGRTVCGFHVWNNLQVITASENRRKSNKLVEAYL